ncbi:MAG TPA: hypothetical protein VF469_33450 [Kofleriaceae bacterium]
MRWWLEDPSGLLTRLLPLVTTLDDRGWTERLRAADLQVVERRDRGPRVESTWALVISTEDI